MSMANTMKRAVFALALALAAGLMFATALPATAHAKKGDDYTYTVRVWAGNEGTVDGKDTYSEIKGIEYGTEMKLSDSFAVKVANDKYYHKGFRLSGTDNQNDDGSSNLRESIVVTEDLDYVVSYGVKGKLVDYTLHYLEQGTNKVLAQPSTRQGVIGDKPVVAFEYVSGYRPLYRNLTGTLKDGKNDWTFYYVPLATGETESGTTTTTTRTTTTTTTGGTTGGTAAGGTAAGGTAAGGTAGGTAAGGTAGGTATGDNAAGGNAAGGNAQGGTAADTQTPPATEEIADVDNPLADGTPGANGTGDSTTGSSDSTTGSNSQSPSGQSSSAPAGPPYGLIFGIALVLVAIVGGIMYYLRSRRE